ncbi:hypothetical protein AGRA3207_005221 [Actinomadura graeca]|uniref:Uncharacterized protein n=1 Tax=Actinomadura graeca TaxID=2750812 RepID=A0ABX8QYR2_9ACTN|nr:hypothetical protein [Actinomadura graeca]QXJ23980.1 hypothetical protein AGRA3207_005221 [Actinomadura graeca]
MGSLRALSGLGGRRQRFVSWWGRAAAIGHLDLLASALTAKGYRCVKLYRAEEFAGRPLLLWVFGVSRADGVRVAVIVHAARRGIWAYYQAGHHSYEQHGYLASCDDPRAAAEKVDAIFRYRMLPAAF